VFSDLALLNKKGKAILEADVDLVGGAFLELNIVILGLNTVILFLRLVLTQSLRFVFLHELAWSEKELPE
jgi:hypothetical protein